MSWVSEPSGSQVEEREGCSRQRVQPLQKLWTEKGGSLLGPVVEAENPRFTLGQWGAWEGFKGEHAMGGRQRTSVDSGRGGGPGAKEVMSA